MIVGVESQIITWGLTMEFSTEELKPLADRLAEMVSRELANGTEGRDGPRHRDSAAPAAAKNGSSSAGRSF